MDGVNDSLSDLYWHIKEAYSQSPQSSPCVSGFTETAAMFLGITDDSCTAIEEFLLDYELYERDRHHNPKDPFTVLAIRFKIGLGLMSLLQFLRPAPQCWQQPHLSSTLYRWTCCLPLDKEGSIRAQRAIIKHIKHNGYPPLHQTYMPIGGFFIASGS